MKPVDVKPRTYIDSSKEINNEDAKFNIGDVVRISKNENIFAKRYVPDQSKEEFLMILILKKLLEPFTKKNCKTKTNHKEFRVEKVIQRKGDKLYIKWKGCNNSFNSWIGKKYIVQMSGYFPGPKSSGVRTKKQI